METIFVSSSPPPFPSTDDSGDEEPASQSDKSELHSTLKNLSSKLEDLSTCNDLIAKHGAALQRSLSELENLKLPAESGEKIKAVNERATLFRITSNAMINVSRAQLFTAGAGGGHTDHLSDQIGCQCIRDRCTQLVATLG